MCDDKVCRNSYSPLISLSLSLSSYVVVYAISHISLPLHSISLSLFRSNTQKTSRDSSYVSFKLWRHDRSVRIGKWIHQVLRKNIIRLSEKQSDAIFTFALMQQKKDRSAWSDVSRHYQCIESIDNLQKPKN